MWAASNTAADAAPLHRPKPRRPFDLEPLTPSNLNGGAGGSSAATGPSSSSKPASELPSWLDQQETLSPVSPTGFSTPSGSIGVADFSKRTKSVLNLTASTLFGIYSHTYTNDGNTEPATPFTLSRTNSVVNVSDTTSGVSDRINGVIGPGNNNLIAVANGKVSPLSQLQPPQVDDASSKSRNASSSPPRKRRHGERTPATRLIVRHGALMAFGVLYGVMITHLHNTKKFTPESWEQIVGYNPVVLLIWGVVGVVLGSLLPWIDFYLGEGQDSGEDGGRGAVADWMQVVRSIGAFVGVAYGIRKLPWQSTLQISLTLSLLNPFLWYTVDRTRAGFWLAAFVGIMGTAVIVQINPDLILAPETSAQVNDTGALLLGGWVSEKTIGVSAWMCSVLFCSCVCFGNIGRRLAFRERDL